MKIMIRNSDSVVIHAGVVSLTPAYCAGNGWIDHNFNTSNATVAEAELPLDWMGAEWAFAAGSWTLLSVAVYNARAAEKLSTIKHAKNEEINASRLVATYTSFEHGGKIIASDQLSRSDIDGINGYVALNNAFPSGWPGAWKAVDNTYLLISSVSEWKALYAAMVAAGTNNFAHAQALKSTLASATTAEDVAAIVW